MEINLETEEGRKRLAYAVILCEYIIIKERKLNLTKYGIRSNKRR